MIIRSQKKICKVNNYSFQIPIDNNFKLIDKIGTYYSAGDNVAYGNIGVTNKINLNTELSHFNPKKDKHHLKVLEGEIVLKGDLLLRKEKLLGSAYEEIVSVYTGIIRLDEFTQGIIKIVGEKKKNYIQAPFFGKTTSISPTENINMDIDCLKVSCFSMNVPKLVKFDVCKLNGLENINVNDVKNKIIYTTQNINISDLEKLIALQAVGVITHYFVIERPTDIDRLSKSCLVIIDGFGNGNPISLPQFDKVIFDPSNKSIYFQNDKFNFDNEGNEFSELKFDDYVRILRSDLYGQIAQVLEIKASSAKVEIGMKALDIPYIYLVKV